MNNTFFDTCFFFCCKHTTFQQSHTFSRVLDYDPKWNIFFSPNSATYIRFWDKNDPVIA